MMMITGLSISLSLSIITVSVTSIMAVSMVIVSWLSNSFPLSIVAMTISTISVMSIAMMVVARLSISLSFHNNRVRNLHNGCIHGDSILAQQQLPSFHSSHDHIHHIHD